MRKFLFIILVIFTISCSDNLFWFRKNPNKIRVEGRVVETYYSNSVIFSVVPLNNVRLRLGESFITETDELGRYRFDMYKDGIYYLFAEKNNYKTKSMRLDLINGPYTGRDFHLERDDEDSPGWLSFPATSDGGRTIITADGLSVYSLGREEVYAIKTITLSKNKTYRFYVNLRKDPSTQLIYFAVQPQIPGHPWITETTNLDKWQNIVVTCSINIDNQDIETVDVTLKVGVSGGTDYPIGYFREIRVE